MIATANLGMRFSGRKLFEDVNLKFTPGNCYGVIGANGAGKSTFVKILSGELEATEGEVIFDKNKRMSVLKQDHFQYEEEEVLNVVLMGNKKLWDIMVEKLQNLKENLLNLMVGMQRQKQKLYLWDLKLEQTYIIN